MHPRFFKLTNFSRKYVSHGCHFVLFQEVAWLSLSFPTLFPLFEKFLRGVVKLFFFSSHCRPASAVTSETRLDSNKAPFPSPPFPLAVAVNLFLLLVSGDGQNHPRVLLDRGPRLLPEDPLILRIPPSMPNPVTLCWTLLSWFLPIPVSFHRGCCAGTAGRFNLIVPLASPCNLPSFLFRNPHGFLVSSLTKDDLLLPLG